MTLTHFTVMAGPVPAIHVCARGKTWMPGTRPGMTGWFKAVGWWSYERVHRDRVDEWHFR